MKLYTMRAKAAKSGQVTLGEARKAARAAKGKRATNKFKVVDSKQYHVLHERYLGEIVHSGGSPGSKEPASGSAKSSAGARPPAKKK